MTILNKIQGEEIDMSDVDNEQDIQKALELEAKKLLKGKQKDQMSDMRSTQYYCNVVFGNKADRDKFLKHIEGEAEIIGETFIDGYELAAFMGCEIACSASLPAPHFVKQIKIKK